MTDAAIIFRSHFEAIENLPEAEQLAALKAVVRYCMDDEQPEGGVPAAILGMAKPVLDNWKSHSKNGKKGGRKKKADESELKANESELKADATETKADESGREAKEKEKVKDKEKLSQGESQKKAAAFYPPTVEEVRAYCQERGNRVDPEHFVDFYTSKGWKVGNQPMKDWKACVRTWERKDAAPPGKVRPIRKGYEERDYDFDAIEREAFAAMMREG